MDWFEKSRPWIAHEAEIEAAHAPFANLLLARAAASDGQHVLDIGCGSGATTLSLAVQVGPKGSVTGIDIAPPMIERTKARTATLGQVTLICDDAQTHSFAPASYDLVVSLFGMMFYTDPQAAFSNIFNATRPTGKLCFAAWAGGQHNPWFACPRIAAENHLGTMPPPPPHAPGPLAFADTERVADMLKTAGWRDIEISVLTQELTPLHSPSDIAALLLKLGPISNMVAHQARDETEKQTLTTAIQSDLATQLSRFSSPQGVRVPAKVNLFTASRPSG